MSLSVARLYVPTVNSGEECLASVCASFTLAPPATTREHYGYVRLWVLLRREGWIVNKKLVYRLYCEEGLGILRRKPRRRKSVQIREARMPVQHANEIWSMDFMSD